MTARYQCTDLPAWTRPGLAYRCGRVLIEATDQPDVVSVDGERWRVLEVES